MINHECVGSLPVCTFCYRPRTDAIHNAPMMPKGITINEISDTTDLNHNPVDIAEYNVAHYVETGKMPGPEDTLDAAPAEGAALPKPTIPAESYTPKVMTVVPPNDIAQAAAEIRRPSHILMEKGRYLTGQESVQIGLDHESFVVLNLIKDKDGKDRDDWQERVQAHILDLRKKIETFRVQEAATMKVRAAKECEDLSKLSPEEIEAYKKAAVKGKTTAKKAAKSPLDKPLDKRLEDKVKARKAAFDALSAMGIPTELINKQLEKTDAEIRVLEEAIVQQKPKPVAETKPEPEPRRLTKRERAIESLMKAGVKKEDAERMVPNA